MPLIVGIVLVVAGAIYGIIFFRKNGRRSTEIRYMQTTPIQEALEVVNSMSDVDLSYRHYVELKGVVQTETMVMAPFTEREVAYYKNKCSSVRQESHVITDNKGNRRTVTNRVESLLSSDQSSAELYITDLSCPEKVYLDMNSFGNDVELMKSCDRFEPQNSPWMQNYCSRFNIFMPGVGSHFLGYRLQEDIFPMHHPLYVLGELYKQGERYYIGRSVRDKKPSFVSYKSEDEIVSNVKKKKMIAIAIGAAAAVAGAIAIVYYFVAYRTGAPIHLQDYLDVLRSW